jgi:hypothetical protein
LTPADEVGHRWRAVPCDGSEIRPDGVGAPPRPRSTPAVSRAAALWHSRRLPSPQQPDDRNRDASAGTAPDPRATASQSRATQKQPHERSSRVSPTPTRNFPTTDRVRPRQGEDHSDHHAWGAVITAPKPLRSQLPRLTTTQPRPPAVGCVPTILSGRDIPRHPGQTCRGIQHPEMTTTPGTRVRSCGNPKRRCRQARWRRRRRQVDAGS